MASHTGHLTLPTIASRGLHAFFPRAKYETVKALRYGWTGAQATWVVSHTLFLVCASKCSNRVNARLDSLIAAISAIEKINRSKAVIISISYRANNNETWRL